MVAPTHSENDSEDDRVVLLGSSAEMLNRSTCNKLIQIKRADAKMHLRRYGMVEGPVVI